MNNNYKNDKVCNNMNKRVYKIQDNDMSDLEEVFRNVDITENSEYTLLKKSLDVKYKNNDSTIELLNNTRERYIRYIKYVNFEENWRIEKEIFEFLRLDHYKNQKVAFELMKYIDNMIIDIIDNK